MTPPRVLLLSNRAYPQEVGLWVIETKTDLPCYQSLHFSLDPFLIISTPKFKRNVYIGNECTYMLQNQVIKNQDQAEQCLIHTFTFSDWPSGQSRYYFFRSLINGELCITSSPILELTR